MGTLIAYAYPTNLFARLADHTYVACGTGARRWSCWGGDTGGDEIARGTGSTQRADAIAGRKDRAGITCYLVNGVCHQAANRILVPAGVIVSAARGYGLSEALFGTYGRPSAAFGLCKAPFERHEGVTGDLAECLGPDADGAGASATKSAGASGEQAYLAAVQALYLAEGSGYKSIPEGPQSLHDFQMQLFELFVEHRLGGLHQKDASPPSQGERDDLRSARSRFEFERLELEGSAPPTQDPATFAGRFNELTQRFQQHTGEILSDAQYTALLDARKGEPVELADPRIMEEAYGPDAPKPRPGP